MIETKPDTGDTRPHPASSTIQTHYNYLAGIPHPKETYTAEQAPKGVRHHRRTYIDKGIIIPVAHTQDKHQSNIYRTDERAYAAIQREKDTRDLLPCGHSGFSHHEDGGYSCGYEFCTSQYPREVVEDLDL